jgi:hypothetical protein
MAAPRVDPAAGSSPIASSPTDAIARAARRCVELLGRVTSPNTTKETGESNMTTSIRRALGASLVVALATAAPARADVLCKNNGTGALFVRASVCNGNETKLPIVFTNSNTLVQFTGANVQVLSGAGATDAPVNGLGNLIVGYNTSPGNPQTGSHNLVVGDYHSYTSFGGAVMGEANSITGPGSTVTGGSDNQAAGEETSISGGTGNLTTNEYSWIGGGFGNQSAGYASSVSGGGGCRASGYYASIFGGNGNVASGVATTAGGGASNRAEGGYDTAIGGSGNVAAGGFSLVCGGSGNRANGFLSVECGGLNRVALGQYDWVAGGLFQDQ